MARVSYIEKNQASAELKPVYEKLGQGHQGQVLNIYKAMAHSPNVLEPFATFFRAVYSGKLDPKLRELAYLKTSRLNHCQY